MTKIEKLEASILDYKKELEQLEAEIELLKLDEEKKKSYEEYSRVGKDETYYSVAILGKGRPYIVDRQDNHKDKPATDATYSYENNNYFKSEKEANKMVDAIKFLFKLQRFYDIYCPNYKPDWFNSSEEKFIVYYDHIKKEYSWTIRNTFDYKTTICFPTKDIAEKVCKRLNTQHKEDYYV